MSICCGHKPLLVISGDSCSFYRLLHNTSYTRSGEGLGRVLGRKGKVPERVPGNKPPTPDGAG